MAVEGVRKRVRSCTPKNVDLLLTELSNEWGWGWFGSCESGVEGSWEGVCRHAFNSPHLKTAKAKQAETVISDSPQSIR